MYNLFLNATLLYCRQFVSKPSCCGTHHIYRTKVFKYHDINPNGYFSLDIVPCANFFPSCSALIPPHSFYALPLIRSLSVHSALWLRAEMNRKWTQSVPRVRYRYATGQVTQQIHPDLETTHGGLIKLTFWLPNGSPALPPTPLSTACGHGRPSF